MILTYQYSSQNLHVRAKEAEQAGEIATAIKLYEQAIKNNPLDDLAYNRQMVLFRKQKDYQRELRVIKSAISSHQQLAQDNQVDWIKKHKNTARTAKALVKSLGMVDKKGMPNLETKQLLTWRKRLAVVQKKIGDPTSARSD